MGKTQTPSIQQVAVAHVQNYTSAITRLVSAIHAGVSGLIRLPVDMILFAPWRPTHRYTHQDSDSLADLIRKSTLAGYQILRRCHRAA
jgi:hypothetical protein